MADVAAVSVKKPHYLWIELVRLIGIWLVIIGHIGATDFIQQLFDLIILQVLMFVSGYLEKNGRPFREVFAKNVKGLLVPYILLSMLLYVYWFIVDIVLHRDIYSFWPTQYDSLSVALLKPIVGILLSNGQYETPYSVMLGLAMWYLPALFIIKMVHHAIIAISRGKRLYYGICLSGSLLSIGLFRQYIQPLEIILPFCLDRVILLIPFFEFGNILREMKIITPPEKLSVASVCGYGIAGLIGLVCLVLAMPLWDGNSVFLYLLLGITSIASVVSFSMLYTRQNPVITLLSNGTLLILAFHAIFIPPVRLIFSLFKFGGMLSVVLQSLLILCIFIIPVNIVQKYCPVLIGSRKSQS